MTPVQRLHAPRLHHAARRHDRVVGIREHKGGLVAIALECAGSEGCAEDHALRQFWKAQTRSLRRPHAVVRGWRWDHVLSVEPDSGDAWEHFEITPRSWTSTC